MFAATTEIIEPDRVTKYRITGDGRMLTYSDVLDLWAEDVDFRTYFTSVLGESEFSAFRWETPALSRALIDRPFEFVLIASLGFATRATDKGTYSEYFVDDDADFGVVTFPNLRGDSTLIVPSPRTDDDVYGHLAAFVRGAMKEQSDALWRVVGVTMKSLVGDRPIWLSTAGGGVAWLHVRIDSRPKYYGYSPYRAG